MDPSINLIHVPKNDLQNWATGSVFKMVNQGANKCLSNVSVMENYQVGYDRVMEYHNTMRNSHIKLKIPPPPKV